MHAVSTRDGTVTVVCTSVPKTIFDDCSNLKAQHIIVAVLQPRLSLPLCFITRLESVVP